MPQHIKDVGIIYDTSVHDIDTALWLFDEVPDVVFAIAGSINHEHEDFATIMLGFKDNKTATISSNWITPTRVRNLMLFVQMQEYFLILLLKKFELRQITVLKPQKMKKQNRCH